MGQGQSGGMPGKPGGDKKDGKDKEKKKYEPPPPPTRIGRKKKKRGPEASSKLPEVKPHTRCKLRLLKLERIKDFLMMEEEFIQNQERLKPTEEKTQEERRKDVTDRVVQRERERERERVCVYFWCLVDFLAKRMGEK